MSDSTLTLYYIPPSPPSRAILLLARALGLKMNLENVNLLDKEQLKPQFVEINPQHSVPCLKDGDFVIAESFAIMTYLIETYAKGSALYPQEPKKKALVHQRVLYVNGTLFPRWSLGYILPVLYSQAEVKKPVEDLVRLVKDGVNVVNAYLEGHKYFAGNELSIADYSLFSTLTSFQVTGVDLSQHDNIVKWMKRCREEFDGVDELDTPGVQTLGAIFNKCLTPAS